MPLAYDEIDGSWGVYSAAWPKLVMETEEEVDITCRKIIMAHKKDFPYGSYVTCGKELRLETQEMVEKMKTYLAFYAL